MTIAERVKLLTGASDHDALIAMVAENAEAEFLDYCNRSDVPKSAECVIAQLAVIRYNQIGAEGLQSQGYSGSSESYASEYPESVRQGLNRYRKVKLL